MGGGDGAREMIIVLGKFEIHPDDFETVKGLAATLMQETVREDGCMKYAFAVDLSQSNCLQLSECWRDDAALSAHFLTAHIRDYREALRSVRVLRREVNRYDVTGSGDL
jgi:quinol monooxygenase YgiN